ncbi:hypothetical protein PF003_g12960 [Phytophthora fragariae]|nr:hypothetical protein PF003_g12960 [Phytophthora fragariae]
MSTTPGMSNNTETLDQVTRSARYPSQPALCLVAFSFEIPNNPTGSTWFFFLHATDLVQIRPLKDIVFER